MLGLSLVAVTAFAAGTTAASRPTVSALAQKPFLSTLLNPSSLVADGSTVSALYIEWLGAGGEATALAVPTTVALVSSDPSVATVPASVRIPAHVSVITVPVATSHIPGSAAIEAKVDGLAASEATLTTVGTAASTVGGAIRLTVSPAVFFRGPSGPAWATAEILDASGQPERVRSPVTLDVTSSAPWVLKPPAEITVPAGAYTSTVPLQIGASGAVTLTALSDGFNPGITTSDVGTAGVGAVNLRATIRPDVLLPGTVPRLVLQADDSNGHPVPFPCGPVLLSSNNPSVLDVPTTATPPCGSASEAVVVNAGAAGMTGTASITVAASGMTPATVKATVAAVPAETLSASVIPLSFAYAQTPEGWLVLQTVLGRGEPVDNITPVTIAFAGGAGEVPASAIIAAGSSSVAVPITGVPPGETPVLVASASGFNPVQITLTPAQRPVHVGRAGGGGGPAITVWGRRIALRWIFAVQVVAAAGLGLGLLLSARRRAGRR